MTELFRQAMLQMIRFEPHELQLLGDCLEYLEFPRRAIIHDIGHVWRHTFFIEEGCLRYYHLVNGEEVTGQFFFEGSWFSDYESFISGEPSRLCVQALEKTKLSVMSKKNIYRLYDEIPRFERLGRLMAERAFIGLRMRTQTLTHLNPEERYLRLLKIRPKVIERIPQHYIASFLGIKPQSLSRIRKRLQSHS